MKKIFFSQTKVIPDAFLMLDNCEIYLDKESYEEVATAGDTNKSVFDPWFDIAIPGPHYVEFCNRNDSGVEGRGVDNGLCRRCHVLLGVNHAKHSGKDGQHDRLKILPPISVQKTATDDNHSNLDANDDDDDDDDDDGNIAYSLRYDGTFRGMKCRCCNTSWDGEYRQRSDASLMIGLALASQDHGNIEILSIKVGIRNRGLNVTQSKSNQKRKSQYQASYSNNNKGCYVKCNACILITFSCREFLDSDPRNLVSKNSETQRQKQQERRRFFVKSSIQLTASTELILSIMNSNWNEYDSKIYEICMLWKANNKDFLRERRPNINIENERSYIVKTSTLGEETNIPCYESDGRNISFFPSKMNLEDVYRRISRVSSKPAYLHSDFYINHEIKKDQNRIATEYKAVRKVSSFMYNRRNYFDFTTTKQPRRAGIQYLLSLPIEIVSQNICKYLRAKSLDSLRCTCKRLHWFLRTVVPGLKLNLYSHQIKSLMWMRERETREITEDELLEEDKEIRRLKMCIRNQLNDRQAGLAMVWGDESQRECDIHRAATGGWTVAACPRLDTTEDTSVIGSSNANVVRISQLDYTEVRGNETLRRCHGYEHVTHKQLPRKVARGGLLCDDPGLGKTVTVIALILQTFGLSTAGVKSMKPSEGIVPSQRKSGPFEDFDNGSGVNGSHCKALNDETTSKVRKNLSSTEEAIFEEYWKEQLVPEYRSRALSKLFSKFLRCSTDVNLFYDNYWISTVTSTEMNRSVYPLSLKDIRHRISEYYAEKDSMVKFVADVESCFKTAISDRDVSNQIREGALRLIVAFGNEVIEFKRSQVQVATKSFSRASAKPDSLVAALIERSNAQELKSSLEPSSATLIVVPTVLVDHWLEQFKVNVDVSYFTKKLILIFEDDGSKKAMHKRNDVFSECFMKQTHFPFIFVDRSATKKLPAPSFLAMFKIVITTNHRFSNEWKNGSFEDEIRRLKSSRSGTRKNTGLCDDKVTSEDVCPLLKVNWVRMIVDEGHSMGRSRDNSSISFASWIHSERRWAMTGTPTPQTSTHSGLTNISNLMQYLQHDFFSRRNNGDTVWKKLIVRGWNRGFISSFFRLRSLLSLLMIRHVKSDILELPLPKFNINILPMGFDEISTYNTLVCAVQSNLLITAMKGKTSGAQDSLLHRTKTKFAREAIRNLRLVCAGGTQVRPTLSAQYWTEFQEDFDIINPDPRDRKKIRSFIARATSGLRSKCDCCTIMLSTLLVFPCGHLVCTECVEENTTSCVICDKEFNVDIFQKLQPGFMYDWLHNLETERSDSENQEAQHVEILPNDHGDIIPHHQWVRRIRSRKLGDGHICEYDPRSSSGKCIFCLSEHDPCYLMGKERCEICHKSPESCPLSESKISYIIDKILLLHRRRKETERSDMYGPKKDCDEMQLVRLRRRPKVMIFSQFRAVLNVTGDRLLRRFGSGCVAEYWGQFRNKELNKFTKDDECICILLSNDGSEGLDLSFVTHIIFLEKVWDKSLENQVIARAWRMGAEGRVDVETLIAESTVEESMFLLEKDVDVDWNDRAPQIPRSENIKFKDEGKKEPDRQHAKVHYLLKNVRLIANTTIFRHGIDTKSNEISMINKTSKRGHLETIKANPTSEKARRKKSRVHFVSAKNDG